jgi:hypothetical protein
MRLRRAFGKVGVLEDWSIGKLEGWKTEVLEGWGIGMMDWWENGGMEYLNDLSGNLTGFCSDREAIFRRFMLQVWEET